jgi:putative endonuclease
LLEGFTKKYDTTRLVWYEQGEDIASAIDLEKKIKNRSRQWKIDLIERSNQNWNDLAASWMDSATPLRFAQNDGGVDS